MHAVANSAAIWRSKDTETNLAAYEQLLAAALKPLVAELVLVNAGILVSYICNRQDAAIADLVDSSSELTLRPGSLRYGRHADVEFEWGEWPIVTLGLEFVGSCVEAHFRLVFGRRSVGIEILGLIFGRCLDDEAANLSRFAAALEDARIQA
jgi:hypothetical protein